MRESASVSAQIPSAPAAAGESRRRVRGLVLYVAAVTLLFFQPLLKLAELASDSELHSHLPLVPLISGYLLYTRRRTSAVVFHTSTTWAAAFVAVGFASIAASIHLAGRLSATDATALTVFAFVNALVAGGFFFLGSTWMRDAAFPVAFLLFMVPMPDAMANALEVASMKASADVAAFFLWSTGTPFVREDQVFALPGIVLRVAEECSGIRSSWVLLITSLLASQVLLANRWRRLLVVAFVIPLAIIRNGFRILVIALMCVHIGPHMIDSFVHRHGGPLFFALSLIPLFGLLVWMRRWDR